MAYITKSGDTWDMIAKETFIFQAGVELSTPALEEERNGLLPPWKYEANYD